MRGSAGCDLWRRLSAPALLLSLHLLLQSGSASADYLVFSGATYWDDTYYGILNTPAGLANLKDQVAALAAMPVGDGDTIVYDFSGFQVIHGLSPSAFLDATLTGEAIDTNVAKYNAASSSFDCVDGDTELNVSGVLLYVGNSHLCATPYVAVLTSSGGGGSSDSDADNDGVPDSSDNCPNTPNANQANNDGDSEGDACDIDDDNDGLSDVEEGQLGTNPFIFDTDGDGIGDGDEILAGTNPLSTDSDGDGWPDNEEIAVGSDPNDSGDVPFYGRRGLRGWRLVLPPSSG